MQIKKRIKKGFTLVELVVVIAVIAILAAVSIGAYFGITDSANRSADEQAVTQMNTMLETHEILNGKVDDVEEAKDIFEDNGLTNYTPFYGKNTFYWTYDDSRVIIWEEEKGVTYPSWAVDKYKDYSSANKTSATWYDLNNDSTAIYEDTYGTLTRDDLISIGRTADDNTTLILNKDSNADWGSGYEFYYLFGYLNINKKVETFTLDLNGSTIDIGIYGASFENKTFIIKNGTITGDAQANGGTNLFVVGNNGKIVLDNVVVRLGDSDSLVYAMGNASEVNILNCDVEVGSWGIATNASHSNMAIYNVKGSKIRAMIAVFLNVNGIVNVENSYLYGEQSAISARTGVLNISNTYMWADSIDETDTWCYKAFRNKVGQWGTGNLFPQATVMLGNYQENAKNGPYAGDVLATFKNCTFDAKNENSDRNTPYLLTAADEGTNVYIDYSNGNLQNSDIIIYTTELTNWTETEDNHGYGGNVFTPTENSKIYINNDSVPYYDYCL